MEDRNWRGNVISRKSFPVGTMLIRTSWMFGKNGKNFVRSIIEKAEVQRELHVVHDQVGAPTYAKDLAHAVHMLLEGDHRGTFHVTNRGRCSWYEYACKILEYVSVGGATVIPVSSTDYRMAAVRPAYSVLSTRKLWKLP
jgi:dTDP-4-dehydrorhamnose reductase